MVIASYFYSHPCIISLPVIPEIHNEVKAAATEVSATEAIIHIVLDKQRNNLILFDLKANLATLAITSGTFLTSIFGMNLMSSLETIPGAFYLACGTAGAVTFAIYRSLMKLLATIRPGRVNSIAEMNRLLKR